MWVLEGLALGLGEVVGLYRSDAGEGAAQLLVISGRLLVEALARHVVGDSVDSALEEKHATSGIGVVHVLSGDVVELLSVSGRPIVVVDNVWIDARRVRQVVIAIGG